MESQRLCRLFFKLSWTFFISSVCLGMGAPNLSLENTVFAACKGDNLTIRCYVKMPANEGKDMLTCSDPNNKKIYRCDVNVTAGQIEDISVELQLNNVTHSGEYYCQYQSAKVYWFLLVRDNGYTEPRMLEGIILSTFIVVLLVFSVVLSVYAFRAHQKEQMAKCGETSGKQKEKKERKTREAAEGDADLIAAPSTSLYASLDPRPRSIYDVLAHSAANRESDQRKAKATEKEAQKTTVQTTQNQDEGVFESVYENF